MIQAFLPTMLERNYGHIVAMSSMAGMMAVPNLVPYCGSKFAVRGIMDTLAMELKSQPRDASGVSNLDRDRYRLYYLYCSISYR
jgi:all-trans-retinol dehydrogenase (NAD+)